MTNSTISGDAAAMPRPALDQAYDEALALLMAARDYARQHRPSDNEELTAEQRLKLSHYTMQVTARLTQVMAWLMANKAVAAGELDAAVLSGETYALPEGGALAGEADGQDAADQDIMPEQLSDLVTRSQALYQRISRLDQDLRARA